MKTTRVVVKFKELVLNIPDEFMEGVEVAGLAEVVGEWITDHSDELASRLEFESMEVVG